MLTLGLMSGTSTDGVDGVLVDWSPAPGAGWGRVLASKHLPMPEALREELLALNHPGPDELHRASLAARALMAVHADVVQALLAEARKPPSALAALGIHGQTVRHRPDPADGGYTLQLAAPAWLAERCGIPVIADFRSRDVAAGGQGAPLVPAFHQALWAQPDRDVAVLNLGGIANLSLLPAQGPVTGFDTGPANALMDLWIARHQGAAYDRDGAWAAGGRVLPDLLARGLADPYFARPAPKSTGRDAFDAAWLDRWLDGAPQADPRDVQATLLALTVESVAASLRCWPPAVASTAVLPLIVCGGGAFNHALMHGLQKALPGWRVSSSAEHGLPPLAVEATAFAWLARAHLLDQPGNLPAVTGARGPRILGAYHPA